MNIDLNVALIGLLNGTVCAVVGRGHPLSFVVATLLTVLYWAASEYA